jgi:hypothetical protein
MQTQIMKDFASITHTKGNSGAAQHNPVEVTWLSILLKCLKTEDTDVMASWISKVIDISECICSQPLVNDIWNIGLLTKSTEMLAKAHCQSPYSSAN